MENNWTYFVYVLARPNFVAKLDTYITVRILNKMTKSQARLVTLLLLHNFVCSLVNCWFKDANLQLKIILILMELLLLFIRKVGMIFNIWYFPAKKLVGTAFKLWLNLWPSMEETLFLNLIYWTGKNILAMWRRFLKYEVFVIFFFSK